jgi:hypothetical protein
MLTALCLVEAIGSKEIKPAAQPQWTPPNRTSASYVSLAQSWTLVYHLTDIYYSQAADQGMALVRRAQ